MTTVQNFPFIGICFVMLMLLHRKNHNCVKISKGKLIGNENVSENISAQIV